MDEGESSEPPGGAVSLSKLKALPVARQVDINLYNTVVFIQM